MAFKEVTCEQCGNVWKQYNSLQKCQSDECKALRSRVFIPKKFNNGLKLKTLYTIPKVSKKRKVENAKYTVQRIQFLAKPENQVCFIDGCNKKADTIEHTMGRKGFADDWARENKISLYLDERFWKPCCLAHNLELENNPELSKKYQLSKIHGGEKN